MATSATVAVTTADTTAAVKPNSPIAAAKATAMATSAPAATRRATRRSWSVAARGTAFPTSPRRRRPIAYCSRPMSMPKPATENASRYEYVLAIHPQMMGAVNAPRLMPR